MNEVISIIQQELIRHSDETTLKSSQHFFKEKIISYGVKTPVVGKIAREQFALVRDFPKDQLWNVCTSLWGSGNLEESFIACNWSYFIHKKYETDDFETFEVWVNRYVNNWASCDTLCNHTIGTLVMMYPHLITRLINWTSSSNRWTRRAAAVSLIIPARNGQFLDEIFGIADQLLYDPDDLVQKGYGWMLKAASQAHQEAVFNYVMKHRLAMPRTSLRYAIEKMPAYMKSQAMQKK